MWTAGITFGSIFGIRLRLHISWFIMFLIVTWNLCTRCFPGVYPAWSPKEWMIVGAATSLLVYASLIGHELAHGLVAKHNGIRVLSITLFAFGGILRIRSEPRHPGVELRMAVAGPAASALIGAMTLGVYLLTHGAYEPLAAVALWLGILNIGLAAFNMVPAFPMDGGRILRSLLWWWTKDFTASTRMASAAGGLIALLSVSSGIWVILSSTWINGLSLVLLGLFLTYATSADYIETAWRYVITKEPAYGWIRRKRLGMAPKLASQDLAPLQGVLVPVPNSSEDLLGAGPSAH